MYNQLSSLLTILCLKGLMGTAFASQLEEKRQHSVEQVAVTAIILNVLTLLMFKLS